MQGAAEGVDHPASGRFEAPQDLGDGVVGSHRVDDKRQLVFHRQPYLCLKHLDLPLLRHLAAQIQPALTDGHQAARPARQQGVQPCQHVGRLRPHIPGMDAQTVGDAGMALGQ
ncbi:hypothetical protein D3C85_1267000 [compost metagenome]